MAYSNPTEQYFCTKCGQRVTQGSRFCRTCGARLPDPDTAPQYDMPYMPPQPYVAPAPEQFYYKEAPQPQGALRPAEKISDRSLKRLLLILWVVYEGLQLLYHSIGSTLPYYDFSESLISPIILDIILLTGLICCVCAKGKTQKIFGLITAGLFLFEVVMYLPPMLHRIGYCVDELKNGYGGKSANSALLQLIDTSVTAFTIPALNIMTVLLCTDAVSNGKKRPIAMLCIALWIVTLCLDTATYAGLSIIWEINTNVQICANVLIAVFQLVCCIGWLSTGKTGRNVWPALTIVAFGLSVLVNIFRAFSVHGVSLDDFGTDAMMWIINLLGSTTLIAIRCVTIIFHGFICSDREKPEK